MRLLRFASLCTSLLFVGADSLATQPADATNTTHSPIIVSAPWARALPPVSANGAAWLIITNQSTRADTLIGASSPIATDVEFHTHVHSGAMMKMEKIDAPSIAAGGTLVMQPGGTHVMLLGLKEPLVAGESLLLKLRFEQAGDIDVTVPISSGPPSHEHSTSGHPMPMK